MLLYRMKQGDCLLGDRINGRLLTSFENISGKAGKADIVRSCASSSGNGDKVNVHL